MTGISIALATYNGETYICEQLESLAAQTLLPSELIVCDDGSQDRTLELVEAFAKRAPFPVHIYRNEERLGYRANFMKAAGLCSGDLIAFCDQDDVWHRQKLACLSPQFDSPNILLVYHNAWVTAADLKPVRAMLSRQIVERLTGRLLPSPWFHPYGYMIIFRRQLITLSDLWRDSVDPNVSSSTMAHDQWFFFLASMLGEAAFIDEPLVSYRQHGGNAYGLPLTSARLLYLRPSFLKSRLAASAKMYLNHQKAAENRVLLLKAMCDGTDENSTERLKAFIKDYQELAERLALRVQLYRSSRFRDRIGIIGQIAGRRGYANNWTWSFGRRALVKDLLLGLPFASA